jgi:hypothetical protein
MGKHKNRCLTTTTTDVSHSAKRWNPEFFKDRRKDGKISDRPFVEALEHIRVQRSNLDVFLQNSELSGSSWEVEQVRKFFREAKSFPEAKLWLDHRSKTTTPSQSQPRWLTSKELQDVLVQQVSSL